MVQYRARGGAGAPAQPPPRGVAGRAARRMRRGLSTPGVARRVGRPPRRGGRYTAMAVAVSRKRTSASPGMVPTSRPYTQPAMYSAVGESVPSESLRCRWSRSAATSARAAADRVPKSVTMLTVGPDEARRGDSTTSVSMYEWPCRREHLPSWWVSVWDASKVTDFSNAYMVGRSRAGGREGASRQGKRLGKG